MSPARPVSAPAASPAPDLAALRAELDQLDDALHDTLVRRAKVVEQVAALGAKGRVPLRPGREAAIIRRLLARHTGLFPASSLVRLWRELICGMTTLQYPLRIAVCDAGDANTVAVAREHFGALVPLRTYPSPAQAIADRSLLGLELALETSRARLGTVLAAAGFAAGPVILRRDPGAASAYALVDVEGFVADDDARLGRLASVLRPPVVLGAYAVPLEMKP